MADVTIFEDVRVVDGHLVAAIVGPEVTRMLPTRKAYCIAVFCDVNDEWLQRDGLDALPFEYQDEGRVVRWPDVDKSISVDEVLRPDAGGMTYFLRWKLDKIRADVCVDEVVGCWKTVAGYTMLEKDGTARVKLVGRGMAADLEGCWRWEQLERNVFRLFPASPESARAYRGSTFTLSRFDGKILELCQSTELQHAGTLDTVALWLKARPPKSWENEVSNV